MNDIISLADFEKQREATFLRLSALTQFVARNSTTETTLVELTGRLLEVRTPQELWPFHIILKQLPSTWPFVQANGNVLCLVIKQLLILAKRSVSVASQERDSESSLSYAGGSGIRVAPQQPADIESGGCFLAPRKSTPVALLKTAGAPCDSTRSQCSESYTSLEGVSVPNSGGAAHADGCPVSSPHRCILRREGQAAVSQPSAFSPSAACLPSIGCASGLSRNKSQPLRVGHSGEQLHAAEGESVASTRVWRPRAELGLQLTDDGGRKGGAERVGVPLQRGGPYMGEIPLGQHAHMSSSSPACSKPVMTGLPGQSCYASPPYAALASYAMHSASPLLGPVPLWYSGAASNFHNVGPPLGAFVPPPKPLGVQFYASGRFQPQRPNRPFVSSDSKRVAAAAPSPSSVILPAKQMDALSASLSSGGSTPGSIVSAAQKPPGSRGGVFPPRATCRKRIAPKLPAHAERVVGGTVEGLATPSQAAIRAAGATLRAFLQSASSTSSDAQGSTAPGDGELGLVPKAKTGASDRAVSSGSCALGKEKCSRRTEEAVTVSATVGDAARQRVIEEDHNRASAPGSTVQMRRVSTVLRALQTALYETKTGSTEKEVINSQKNVSVVRETAPFPAGGTASPPNAVPPLLPVPLSSVNEIIDLDNDDSEDTEAVEDERTLSREIGGEVSHSEDPEAENIEESHEALGTSAETKNGGQEGGVSVSTVDPSTGPSEDDQTSPPSAGGEPSLHRIARDVIEHPSTLEAELRTEGLADADSNQTPPLVELPELIWGPPPASQSFHEATTPPSGKRKRQKESGDSPVEAAGGAVEECPSDEDRVTSGDGFDWSKLRGVGARSFETSMDDIMSMFDRCASVTVPQVSTERPCTQAPLPPASEFWPPVAGQNAQNCEADWLRWRSCELPVQNGRCFRRRRYFTLDKRNGKRPAVSSILTKNRVNQASCRDRSRVRKSQETGLAPFSVIERDATAASRNERGRERSNWTAWWDRHKGPINLFNTRADEERLYLYLSTSSAESTPPFLQPPYCVAGSVVLDWGPSDWSDSSTSCDTEHGNAVVQRKNIRNGSAQGPTTESDRTLCHTTQQRAVYATTKTVEPEATRSGIGLDMSPIYSDPESVSLFTSSPEPSKQQGAEHPDVLLPSENICRDEGDLRDTDVIEVVYVFVSPSDVDDDVVVCS